LFLLLDDFDDDVVHPGRIVHLHVLGGDDDPLQPGDTVQDTKIVDVTNVASGATATWATAGAPGQHNLACVVRQVQAQ